MGLAIFTRNSMAPIRSPATPAVLVPSLAVVVLALLVGLSTLSTKLAGLILFAVLAAGVVVRLRQPLAAPVDAVLRAWMITACGAFVLQAAATLWWRDSWGSRHFEVRLLLSALALWLFMPRVVIRDRHKAWLMHGMAAACWAGLGLTWVYERDTPTNPIPWAAGLSFMACVLAARCLQGGRPVSALRWFWMLSAVAGLGGVILSQSRGSFGLAPWLGVLAALLVWQSLRGQQAASRVGWGLAGLLALVLVVLAMVPRLYQGPLERIQTAHREWGSLVQAIETSTVTPQVLDTSVGARLFLYIEGWKAISQSPVAGHGERQRQAWVKDLGRRSGSQVIESLDHLHSDPLSRWFDHGLLGMASYTVSVLGLLWLAWRARSQGPGMALGFVGLAWMHGSTGLTNMNTLHNYYGVMLSLGVMLVFLLQSPASGPSDTSTP